MKDDVSPEVWLKKDLVAQKLLEMSHLKKETLLPLMYYTRENGITFEKIAKKMKIRQPNAWKRYQKAKNEILRSFCTLKLALHAGVLDEKVADLIKDDLLDYLGLLRNEVDESEAKYRMEKRMIELINRLKK
ncbi:MAG: hypothetical protein QXH08_00500 [Candidatus Hadarchaeales archaeon]